jgi:hypothetical protein
MLHKKMNKISQIVNSIGFPVISFNADSSGLMRREQPPAEPFEANPAACFVV